MVRGKGAFPSSDQISNKAGVEVAIVVALSLAGVRKVEGGFCVRGYCVEGITEEACDEEV